MAGNEVQKWADKAMYAAQPIDATGPKVTILSCNPDPLGNVAAATMTYEGKFVGSLAEITDEQRRFYLDDVQKAKRWAPLEFVRMHFLIEGVSRTFTHQLVRQRTAAYAQESMRFAVKETVPVHLPSSMHETTTWAAHWKECAGQLFPAWTDAASMGYSKSQTELIDKFAEEQASKSQMHRKLWDEWMASNEYYYNKLVDEGLPAEDAREGLPVGTLTRVHYTTDLRYLLEHCGQRLCTQAQHEWKQVWAAILVELKRFGATQMYLRPPLNDDGSPYTPQFFPMGTEQQANAAWQFDELTKVFKPICYQTGKCEFNSSADRFCAIKDRVNGYASLGIPSYKWGQETISDDDVQRWPGIEHIPAIRDEEWMNNEASARISQ